MKNLFCFLVVFVLIGSSGCSLHRPKPASVEASSPLKEARVFKSEQFLKGGKLLVVPFSAGEGVAADDDLDRISLLIVKGIADVLAEDEHRFQLVNAEDSQEADVVMKGRIIKADKKSSLSKPWGKKPKHLTLSVEAIVLGVESENILAKFNHAKEIQGRGVSLENLAYETGVDIGHFLVSQVK